MPIGWELTHVNTIWLLVRERSFIKQSFPRPIVISTNPADFFQNSLGDKESTFLSTTLNYKIKLSPILDFSLE